MNLCSYRDVTQLMNEYGISFQKKFGQNFLTNEAVVESIADYAGDDSQSTILEIGPGIGTLTQKLCERYHKVIAVEIDRGLIPILDRTLADFDNVTVLNQDIMKTNLSELLKDDYKSGKVSVCGNLPYYITSDILMMILESGLPFSSVTVMVQKEVAQRVCSPVGGKDCGAITASIAYYGEAKYLFEVPANNFIPQPKVDSAVLRIDLYPEKKYKPKNEKLMFRVIKSAFALRRKTILNALASAFPDIAKETIKKILSESEIDETIRGERLTLSQFVTLSDNLFTYL